MIIPIAILAILGLWALIDYESFWFTLEFWLPPDQRRPFTYIMRDLYHQAAGFVVSFLGFLFTGVGIWLAGAFPEWKWHILIGGFVFFFTGALVAHLFWGAPWVPGQMPEPKVYKPTTRVLGWQQK